VSEVETPIHVVGGNGTYAQLWLDGAMVSETPVTSDDFTATLRDSPAPGNHRYRLELVDPGNRRLVITSHIYVRTIAAASDGCGCHTGGLDAAPSLLLGLLPLLRRRRRHERPPAAEPDVSSRACG
jgi:hypothetical protein